MKSWKKVMRYLRSPFSMFLRGVKKSAKYMEMKWKPAVAMLVTVTMLLSIMPMQSFALASTVEISTLSELQSFKSRVDSGESSLDAVLTASIDMSSVTDWNGIGTEENPYTGTFNGQGYTISNLTGSMGLFAESSGTVKNVYLKNVNINGGGNNGAVVGHNKGSVFNCVSTGKVVGSSWSVGGIVGYNEGGTVRGCISSCTVSGGTAGGLVGSNWNGGRVSYSYYGGANANIEGDSNYAKASSEAVYFQTGSGYQLYNDGSAVSAETVVTTVNTYITNNGGYFKLSYSGNTVILPHAAHPICGAAHTDIGDHTGTCSDIEWTAWDGTTDIEASGNYYLTASPAQLSESIGVCGSYQTPITVNLCLNGQTLDLGSSFIYIQYATVNLCDCSAGKTAQITSTHSNNTIIQYDKSTLNMYGGTVIGTGMQGTVYLQRNRKGTFNLYGGRITNNYSYDTNGGVKVQDGTFHMYGGTISGGAGRGVFAASGATVIMEDGAVIENNISAYAGAGVYMSDSTASFTMNGGVIRNNQNTGTSSDGFGGGIYLEKGTVTINGGTITGNQAGSFGGGIFVSRDDTVSLKINGGNITGNTVGNSVASNIHLAFSMTITVGDLAENTKIGITMLEIGKFSVGGAAYKDNFTSDNSDYAVTADGSNLKLVMQFAVSFDKNGGTGSMGSVKVADGAEYTLPACGFTAPRGYRFKGWATATDGSIISDTTITVEEDTALYAIWESIPADTPTVAGENVTLTYKGYTDKQVSVSVTEQPGYTYSYQWYDSSRQPISGATDSAYTVTNDLTVGSYDYYCVVTAEREDNKNTATAESKITVTVNKATAALTAPSAQNTITYGEKLSAVALNDGWVWANGNTVPTVKNNGYVAYYTPADTANYDWTTVEGWNETEKRVERTVPVTVNKAALIIKAKDNTITYGDAPVNDGVTYSGFVNGENETVLDGAMSYDYGYTQYGDVGEFDIIPKGLSSDNYAISFEKGILTVNQKEISIGWANTEFTYDGTAHKPTATTTDFVSKDVALAVSGEQTDSNKDGETYTATVAITGAKAGNYKFAEGTATKTEFIIKKADQNAPAVQSANETISGKKDGSITAVDSTMEYRKEGDSIYTTVSGDEIEDLAAGKYYVRLKGDSNHNPSPDTEVMIAADKKLTVTVPSAQEQIGYTLTVDQNKLDWHGPVTITFALAEGYSKSNTDFAVKVNGTAITLDENDQYIVTDAETDLTITVAGIVDETAPEVEISIASNKWTAYLKDITFGLFFKKTEPVIITATDKSSGVDTVYYYISETVLTEDEVKALSAEKWTQYDADNKPSIDPDKKCVIYAKAVDKAQNVKYISSTGLVFDGTAPVISGIENGKDYCGDVAFTANDAFAGIKEIKVDGKTVTLTEGKHTILADNAEHTVTVTDNAGNTTEWKITVYKQYTVTFMDENGVYQTVTVKHGEKVTMPEAPTKDGYTVTWEKTLDCITGDVTVKAVYTKIPVADSNSPQTGDNSHMALWIVLLFLSGGAVITLTVCDRKRRKAGK